MMIKLVPFTHPTGSYLTTLLRLSGTKAASSKRTYSLSGTVNN